MVLYGCIADHSQPSDLQLQIMPFSTCRFELPSAAGDFSSPKPGHTTSGSGRGARRIGGAGPGRTGRRQNSSPRRQESLVPPKASKTGLLNVSPEARTSEILCKPNAGTKSPVDKWFVSGVTAGREALFVPGCRPVDRCFFASVNPFHARHVRKFIQNLVGKAGKGGRKDTNLFACLRDNRCS